MSLVPLREAYMTNFTSRRSENKILIGDHSPSSTNFIKKKFINFKLKHTNKQYVLAELNKVILTYQPR